MADKPQEYLDLRQELRVLHDTPQEEQGPLIEKLRETYARFSVYYCKLDANWHNDPEHHHAQALARLSHTYLGGLQDDVTESVAQVLQTPEKTPFFEVANFIRLVRVRAGEPKHRSTNLDRATAEGKEAQKQLVPIMASHTAAIIALLPHLPVDVIKALDCVQQMPAELLDALEPLLVEIYDKSPTRDFPHATPGKDKISTDKKEEDKDSGQ